ncbi:hypothetical protein [Moraxella caprae]|uniref:hypothetical protein n=1 Tax=Moraxella caprae TaxID=90240 RepID=UPI0003FA1652|nr:hypothetical protein [Moraxella caprae]
MSGIKYLIDTCFILGLYNSNPKAIEIMAGVHLSECAISPLTAWKCWGLSYEYKTTTI